MDSATARNGSAFTHNGDFFALVSIDGRLRIWDAVSGKLIQEFSSNSVAESSCTCLCWTRDDRRSKSSKEPLRKKQKKKKATNVTESLSYPSLVLGTRNGNLITYDPNNGEGKKSFTAEHIKDINSLAYHKERDKLYTCSKDRYIIEWCYEKEELITKWKADKLSVEAICVSPSGNNLLSAGQSIKLWDLDTKKLLQKFNGHSSPISLLRFTTFKSSDNSENDQGYYFLSGATEERVISVWNINLNNPIKSSIASYMLPDIPVLVDSLVVSADEKPLKVCVACRDGTIQMFENLMNGKTSRPLESTKVVNVLQNEGKKSKPVAATFYNMAFYEDSSVKLKISFGSSIKPIFELFEYGDLKTTTEIVRDIREGYFSPEITEDVETISMKKNKIIQVVSSASFVPIPSTTISSDIVIDVNGNEEDRQKTDTLDNLLSMEERLTTGKPSNNKTINKLGTPSAGSFSQMLIQALHSNDENLLNDMLFNSHSDIVLKNTVKRIPQSSVMQLLLIIIEKLKTKPSSAKYLSKWLQVIMGVHLIYLMSNPDSVTSLSSLYQIMKAQQEIQPKLLSIQGKVDLLLAHSALVKSDSSDDDNFNVPNVVFHDDSEDEMEDLFHTVTKPSDKNDEDSSAEENVTDADEEEEELENESSSDDDDDSMNQNNSSDDGDSE